MKILFWIRIRLFCKSLRQFPDIMSMQYAIGLTVTGIALWFLWSLVTTPESSTADPTGLDAASPQDVDCLIGLFGGSITDAASARFALQRFEQINGRKATSRDVGVLMGLMSSNPID